MIFRTSNVSINLRKHGILVPLLKDRAERVFEELLKNSLLKDRMSEWFSESNAVKIESEDLLRVHDNSYVQGLLGKFPSKFVETAYELFDDAGKPNRYDPTIATEPFSLLISQVLMGAGGTYLAMQKSLDAGFCFYLNSYAGAHHAMSFGGRGFCLINDIVIGLKKLISEKKIENCWVIDIDAHKGDGTAELTKGDDSIRTLSIHMEKGWPLDGDRRDSENRIYPWYIESDVDIAIGKGCERDYLGKLEIGLKELDQFPDPDLVIVVDGSDPFEKDALLGTSLIQMSEDELLARDQLVYNFLQNKGVPHTWLMAGGYGEEVFIIYYQFLKWVLERRLV